MKPNLALFLLSVLCLCLPIAKAQEPEDELAELLYQLTELGEDRWDITFAESNDRVIIVNSKETALGEFRGYSFRIGESEHKLHFLFHVVEEISELEANARRAKLEELRKLGELIKHENQKGYVSYEPEGIEQWNLVIQIRQAEKAVADIPEYQHQSVFLSVDYAMDFFEPNKENEQSLQYKRDIEAFYQLLKPVEAEQQ